MVEGDGREKMEKREDDEKQNEMKANSKGTKSCKGFLYYSSALKSENRNPRCIGIPRTLRQGPGNVIGQEIEVSKEGRDLLGFYYACAGYSIYRNRNNMSANEEESKIELPACTGLELVIDRRASNAHAASLPPHVQNQEDGELRQPTVHGPSLSRPSHSVGDDFLSRFQRNAKVVASGVVRNIRKVGNQIKASLDDILYPYRKRPK